MHRWWHAARFLSSFYLFKFAVWLSPYAADGSDFDDLMDASNW